MPRQHLRKWLPKSGELKTGWAGNFFGNRLADPDLWHLNRRSVSAGVAIGLFSAYLPMPGETVVAVALAILFRANLPLSAILVWISNPLTWLPLYAPAYYVGARLTGVETVPIESLTLSSLTQNLAALWTGCLLFGTIASFLGYVAVRVIWRSAVVSNWQARRRRRRI